MPDGYFRVLIFSESKLYDIYNGENHFQVRGQMVVRHSAFLRKLALNVEDFYVKTMGQG